MDRDLDRVLDEYLVLQGQGGSRPALEQLVERWSPRLLRHAGRLLNNAEAARAPGAAGRPPGRAAGGLRTAVTGPYRPVP
jgi:hypothetical protein